MRQNLKSGFDLKKEERRIFFIFALTIVGYTVFALFGDIKKVVRASLTFDWRLLPLLIFLTSLNYLFRFIRWRYLLKKMDIDLPLVTSLRIFLSGLSMTVTPGKMGEVLKAYLVKKATKTNYAEMIPLLIFERLTDGIGMIILALGGLYLFRNLIFLFVFAVGLVATFFLFVLSKSYILRLIKRIEKSAGHVKILDFFILFFANSERLIKFQTLTVSVILSVIAWSFEGVALFLLVSRFTVSSGVASLLFSLLVFSFSSIAGFIALIPGGIGVAEGSITSLIAYFYHLPLYEAIFITLLFRFITLWYGVAVGFFNLLLYFSRS
ncbi:flippase-like domain-containing protein [Candidatus Roizmanbacteria bacterium]|nr:flippase-like domain-containing protein [Candidatus Roizmanbacteria bacterium]